MSDETKPPMPKEVILTDREKYNQALDPNHIGPLENPFTKVDVTQAHILEELKKIANLLGAIDTRLANNTLKVDVMNDVTIYQERFSEDD